MYSGFSVFKKEYIMDMSSVNESIGLKIRNLRQQNGLTQQELADRTELTKGFISQLENGQVSPSVVTLLDLIECLGTTPDKFFKEEKQTEIVFGEKDYFDKYDEAGNLIQWVVPTAQGNQMEPLHVVILPKQALKPDRPHAGEEFGYVIRGSVTVTVGEDRFTANAGESFYYQTNMVHALENAGDDEAELIWVSTPPNF